MLGCFPQTVSYRRGLETVSQQNFIATMESDNFSWMAVGESEALAKELIAKAFRKHIKQYPEVVGWPRSNADLIKELHDSYGIMVVQGGVGSVWRDGSSMEVS